VTVCWRWSFALHVLVAQQVPSEYFGSGCKEIKIYFIIIILLQMGC
jgi:hypothetical protein